MTHLPQNKLFRDLSSLADRYAAATAPGRPEKAWTPAAAVVADVLARLVTMLGAWGTPAAERSAARLTSAFAPRSLDAIRLAELASRYVPRDRALELARNLVESISDGVEDLDATIAAAIAHRRDHFGLTMSDDVAIALGEALVRACSPEPSAAEVDELGAAIRKIARGAADAAMIHDRMLARIEVQS